MVLDYNDRTKKGENFKPKNIKFACVLTIIHLRGFILIGDKYV